MLEGCIVVRLLLVIAARGTEAMRGKNNGKKASRL